MEERFHTSITTVGYMRSYRIYAVLRCSALTADSGVFTYLHSYVPDCDVKRGFLTSQSVTSLCK